MAASPQKPMVVPGPPTGATLEVVSSYQLKVIFSPPDDDGGDAVTKYTVEWDTDSSFASANKGSAVVTQLQGGAPFVHTIGSLQSKLTKGTFYFVRVTASNSQGTGASVRTSPASLNPSEPPTAPTGVELGSTSPSMLTVTFGPPVSDGGDTVTKYQIEWDKDPTFNSLELAPHKGVVQVASTERSYTISLLTVNTQYYVRVSAVNGQGVGTPQKATPLYEKPQLQVPGKPVDVTAVGTPGKISVAWKRPVVPHHGLPCFGTASNPGGCPAYPGSTTSMSDGGAVVSKYKVQYSQDAAFATSEVREEEVTSGLNAMLATEAGVTYYVRVLAYNSKGFSAPCGVTGALCDASAAGATAVSAASS